MSRPVVKPSLVDALIPVVVLITMLAGTVYVFGLDSFGPNQVALFLSAAMAALIGIKNGLSWKEVEQGMIDSVPFPKDAMPKRKRKQDAATVDTDDGAAAADPS